ncbi:hypothetical protein EMN47_17725 [Prolixibacteraceae bacterium JC049]|nr:hypothetical protein [Prolixibacteraceae bacterium JC049]
MSVQVTNNDLVLLGHGSYQGGAKNVLLPDNVDLYVLQPVGYTLTTTVAAALIRQEEINRLRLLHDGGRGNTTVHPPMAIYKGGELAPDLILHDLGNLAKWGAETIADKENVITVNRSILLSEIIKTNNKIKRVVDLLGKGERLKLYWSACACQISGNRADL